MNRPIKRESFPLSGMTHGLLLGAVLSLLAFPAWGQTLASGADTEMGFPGYPLLNGSASVNGNVLTINGAGADIWVGSLAPNVNPVQGNYFRWNFSGDGSITARVVSLTNTNRYAKAALIFGDVAGPLPTIAMTYAIPSGQAAFFTTNMLHDTGLTASSPYLSLHYPLWLRLSRVGTLYTGYASQDGQNWVQLGPPFYTHLQEMAVGLAVTSHDPQHLATGVFDNISIMGDVSPEWDFSLDVTPAQETVPAGQLTTLTLNLGAINPPDAPGIAYGLSYAPAGWTSSPFNGTFPEPPTTVPLQVTPGLETPPGTYSVIVIAAADPGPDLTGRGHTQHVSITIPGSPVPATAGVQADIGAVPQPGFATLVNGVLNMQASGYISNNPDRLHFYYWTLTGDGSITARLTGLTGATSASKAGLMVRQSLNSTAPYAMASAPQFPAGQTGFQLQYRTQQSRSTFVDQYSLHVLPLWMRLIRSGENVTVHWSNDGLFWFQDVRSATTLFGVSDPVLIGIAADTNAVFDNISLTGATQ